jgi:hypothetical protein
MLCSLACSLEHRANEPLDADLFGAGGLREFRLGSGLGLLYPPAGKSTKSASGIVAWDVRQFLLVLLEIRAGMFATALETLECSCELGKYPAGQQTAFCIDLE